MELLLQSKAPGFVGAHDVLSPVAFFTSYNSSRRVSALTMVKQRTRFPRAIDPARVGKYPAFSFAGGGFVWDAVLEYRVWCHPERGAPDEEDGNDYYFAFESYPEALRFSKKYPGAEEPLALILQKEYIAEPAPRQYVHVKKRRITEWPVAFLSRPRRTRNTIPDFLSPSAPRNRLAILRGLARKRVRKAPRQPRPATTSAKAQTLKYDHSPRP